MKSKHVIKNLLGLSLVLLLALFVSSCDKEDDTPTAPTIKIQINSVDGFKVDIAAQASNDVVKWHWDYGDGNTSDSVGGHYYTYTERGDFTIKCTVTNEAGVSASAETNVHIATLADIISSHPWKLSNSGNNGLGFYITTDLTVDFPVSDVLGTINNFVGGDDVAYDFTAEYNDVYTFNPDGTYEVNFGENGNVLSSWVYAKTKEENNIVGSCNFVGMYVLHTDPVSGAKWSMHAGESLTLNTVFDPDQSGSGDDGVQETVTFENANYVTFENGGFLGIKDYTSTFVIRSLTENKMEVSLFFHGYLNADQTIGINEPSFNINLTFVPASK